jgi:NAD(P)H-hydrate epimerase
LLSKWRGVAVLDADFLNLITDTAVLRESPARLVLTPHIGEMARLCRLTIDEIRQNPVETARKFAVDNGLVLVLKSAITLIAEPRGRVYINSRPNSGLARGGSGDLLAGLIAGLATTGISELNAAVAGVFLLSEAAELARGELGADAMTISETASYLPRAFRTLRGDLPASQP